MKKCTLGDALITGEILLIGLAEGAHLTALFGKLSFTKCVMLFWTLTACACFAGNALLLVRRLRLKDRGTFGGEPEVWSPPVGGKDRFLLMALAAMVLSQLIFIAMGNPVYRQGDLTVETVESFLASDSIYQMNPLTGMPYREGMPFRLKILCLPTLYGSLCKLTGLRPVVLVQRIVPMAVLLSSYAAFASVGRVLFPQEGRKRLCFLLVTALLLWAGAYRWGMDGFDLLCSGWRGVSIRGGVLLPWLLSLCLRGKWFCAVLCILAECCLVWTFYGGGVCLAVALGMALAQLCCRRFFRTSGEAAGSGQEDRK